MESKVKTVTEKAKKKVEPINNILVKVPVSADTKVAIMDRLGEQEKIVGRLQKHLISWWKKQTDKRFIIVVDYGNLGQYKNIFNYKIDLTQLNLDEDTIAKFTEGVEVKVKEFLDNERDL